MSNVRLDSNSFQTAINDDSNEQIDLIGGLFTIIESDPGIFTSLTCKLGVKHLEIIEVYVIEPWTVDHFNLCGLVFCFCWRKDMHRPANLKDPAAEHALN
ncbi:hypothetical protein EDD18DRAFT_1357523 [Armillaria luteobubalina]|uniref:ubiquitinyl hydrolase 1 n=1 Tax=Armillaria luteobubalina TaxID=153913 RepID=A0AA39UTX2_9AGAR|nr:hypothetical protein EDD18DRAFT_1357523 [Armillaria luteobubalina]